MSDELKYEVCAMTGTYEKDGETKKRYKRVGDLRENKYGLYLAIDATFNPAGVPHEGDRIFLSLFEPKPKERVPGSRNTPIDLDDEIKF